MGSHYKILVADDSLLFLKLVHNMLNQDMNCTYEVIMADNGWKACALTYHNRPDIILIDIEMPVMNGIDAIKKIKGNKLVKRTPIIVVSSTKQFQDAFFAGADDFLLKPIDKYELLMRIQLNLKLAQKGNELKKQHEILKAQKLEAINQRDVISKQKADLMNDLHYARFVQNAVLPYAENFSNLFNDHFIYNRPKYIVSGDFYWVTRKNGLIMVAVGDCTGHGMSGALMTMAGVAFLNEIISNSNQFSADQILNELRKKVIQLLNQKGDIGEASNGMDIALCVYNETHNTIQFAGANNPLYLVKKGEPLQVIKGDRMPIGFFFEHERPFTKKEIQVSKGDTIYMFTDGYPDQFGGPFEKKFRYNQFQELIGKAASFKTMGEQLELIKKTMNEWIEGYEQIDDMLILGIRF